MCRKGAAAIPSVSVPRVRMKWGRFSRQSPFPGCCMQVRVLSGTITRIPTAAEAKSALVRYLVGDVEGSAPRSLSASIMASFYQEIYASEGVLKTYVNGEWVTSSSGNLVKILNPQDNKPAFHVQGVMNWLLVHESIE